MDNELGHHLVEHLRTSREPEFSEVTNSKTDVNFTFSLDVFFFGRLKGFWKTAAKKIGTDCVIKDGWKILS